MKPYGIVSAPAAALTLFCAVFLCLSYASYGKLAQMADADAAEGPRTIVIDAGHGGEDGGAEGSSGRLEKDINLAIAKDMQQIFTVCGYRAVMTRNDDTALSDPLKTIRQRKTSDLHNRLKFVQAQGNCILVSIHQNHFEQSQYHGTQVFYSTNNPDSKVLAEAIRSRIVSLLQKDNTRETKPATSSIYLLWNVKTPAVLVECGFLSNSDEEKKLNTEDYQQKIAFAICSGLKDYCAALE